MRIPTKTISAVAGQAVEAAHLAAARQQQMATRPMQEVKETIIREVLTSTKVQEAVGKILNKVV